MNLGVLVLVLLASATVCAGVGSYVSAVKGRGSGEGFIIGGLLGPLGVLVVALLPQLDPDDGNTDFIPLRSPWASDPEPPPDPEEEAAWRHLTSGPGSGR